MIELLKRIASDAKEIDEQQKDICEIDEGLPYCMLVPERARKEYRRNRHSSTGTVTATELTTFALRMVSASVVSQRHRLKEVVTTEIVTTETAPAPVLALVFVTETRWKLSAQDGPSTTKAK